MKRLTLCLLVALALPGGACSKQATGDVITIDGSSTVFPITEAVAEDFQQQHPVRVAIGVSGTGGGFKKLCGGEAAIAGASRPIKQSEMEQCKQAGIEYIELPVAFDGIAVVVHPGNDWVGHMTVAELRALWKPEAQARISEWSQIRTGWPDKEIHLFGPGVDSGTYDYFTMAVVGTEHASRGDFTSSEDDNVLVQGVSSDPLALGFFGFAYYAENATRLKLVPIDDGVNDNGAGPVAPTPETILRGTYQPLSRPIFIYIARAAAERKEVQELVHFYLDNAARLVPEVGYVPLPPKAYELSAARFDARTTGSLFSGGSRVGVPVESILSGE